MWEIQEDLHDVKDRIGFKEQRHIAAENLQDYTKCDHLCEQMKSLRAEVGELEAEYKQLERKNSQSKWYLKKVSAVRGLSDEEQSQPPPKKRKSRSTTPFALSSPSEPSTPLSTDNVSQPLSPESSVMYSSEDAHSSSNCLSLSPEPLLSSSHPQGTLDAL